MSGADSEAMEYWDLGLSRVPETLTCSRHIDEPTVKSFILKNAFLGTCNYCARSNTKVVELETLMRFLMEAVAHFYTDPADFMRYESAEGGYIGNVYNGWEILCDKFQLNIDNCIIQDIESCINWDRPWADEGEYWGDHADFLDYHWNYFKKVVKHRSRFLFGKTSDLHSSDYHLKPYDILTNIGEHTLKYNLVQTLPTGTSIIRCRQHPKEFRVTEASQICSPPEQFALGSNRMSPAGISMFYGAFDAGTCIAETINQEDAAKTHYSVATFRNTGPLMVVDLSVIPPVPSVFDKDKWDDLYPIIFLRAFAKDLSRPIERDNRTHIEYVPTQIITEYYRYAFKDGPKRRVRIDGIIYPSSRKGGKNACVLFMDHKESLTQLEFLPEKLVRKKC